jgi:hypothetical protein
MAIFADETSDKHGVMRRVMFGMVAILTLGVLWFAPQWSSSLPVEAQTNAGPVPAKLTDQQFWTLSNQMSEPNGHFRSENLVSNEHTFQYVIPSLERRVRGGVYVGVAPDQNFTYIAAIKPKIAFIVDIRRGNLLQHLMFKALFELSADRAEFVSRLFSKPRPKGLGAESTVEAIFEAFGRVDTSETLYKQNVRDIHDVLLKRHGFKLSPEDMQQLEGIYWHFYWEGPHLRYTMSAPVPTGSSNRGFGFNRGTNFPTYEDQVQQADWEGRSRSYLATEETFAYIKAFEEKNLLVPVVGNFAGPKALRSVGKYARDHQEVISAFYVSNVEQYLFQDNIWTSFYQNVATMPVDDVSTFIRSVSTRMGYTGPMQWRDGRATALDPMKASIRDFRAGRIRRYYDLNARWQ